MGYNIMAGYLLYSLKQPPLVILRKKKYEEPADFATPKNAVWGRDICIHWAEKGVPWDVCQSKE